MTEMINNDTVRETFVLVGAQTPDMSGNIAMEDSLNELEELVHTAGAECVGKVIQIWNEFIREHIWAAVNWKKSSVCCWHMMRQGLCVMMSCRRLDE